MHKDCRKCSIFLAAHLDADLDNSVAVREMYGTSIQSPSLVRSGLVGAAAACPCFRLGETCGTLIALHGILTFDSAARSSPCCKLCASDTSGRSTLCR